VPLKSLCSQFQVNTIKILFKILFLINLVCLELAMIVPMPKSRVLKILHFKHPNAALPFFTYRFKKCIYGLLTASKITINSLLLILNHFKEIFSKVDPTSRREKCKKYRSMLSTVE